MESSAFPFSIAILHELSGNPLKRESTRKMKIKLLIYIDLHTNSPSVLQLISIQFGEFVLPSFFVGFFLTLPKNTLSLWGADN